MGSEIDMSCLFCLYVDKLSIFHFQDNDIKDPTPKQTVCCYKSYDTDVNTGFAPEVIFFTRSQNSIKIKCVVIQALAVN